VANVWNIVVTVQYKQSSQMEVTQNLNGSAEVKECGADWLWSWSWYSAIDRQYGHATGDGKRLVLFR